MSGKRSFNDYDSDAGRRLESQLRRRLEYAEERRQRSREADRDYGSRRSPEWRRGKERHREDERRFEAGPSFVTEQFSKKKVGVHKFSARSRAAAGNPTPTPPPHAPPTRPPPSAGLSSQSDPPEPPQGQKKAGIKCYNYSRDGHYQSGCIFPAHYSVCDLDGHTAGVWLMAPEVSLCVVNDQPVGNPKRKV
jgi:hypothetical protein